GDSVHGPNSATLSPSVLSSATSMLPSSTVPVMSPTAQMGCMSVSVDDVADAAAEVEDAAVGVAARVHAVGQQAAGEPALEIDPEPRAGETGVTDHRAIAGVAAGPAGVEVLPAVGALVAERRAHHRHVRVAAVEQRGGEVEHRVDGTEQPRVAGALQRPAVL